MTSPGLPDASLCVRLAVTIGHFLWQGAAVALVVLPAGLILRRAVGRSSLCRSAGGAADHGGVSAGDVRVAGRARGSDLAAGTVAGRPGRPDLPARPS